MRTQLIRARNTIPEDQRQQWSGRAIGFLTDIFRTMQIKNFAVYIPFRSELNTRSLVEWGWNNGIQVLVPKCNPNDYSMQLCPLKDWNELSFGAYGIQEPNLIHTSALSDPFVPEVIVLPGLAFDRNGGRLGYGSGYYDRLYERLQPWFESNNPPVMIGLGFHMQIVDKVPMGEHDTRLNLLVSEKGVMDCSKEDSEGM
ncbi:5-formyltetrahydrofolate cyclo-ligase [Paenibacillus sp. CMAA1364]